MIEMISNADSNIHQHLMHLAQNECSDVLGLLVRKSAMFRNEALPSLSLLSYTEPSKTETSFPTTLKPLETISAVPQFEFMASELPMLPALKPSLANLALIIIIITHIILLYYYCTV